MNYIFALILAFNIGGYFEYSGQNFKDGNTFPYTGYNKINFKLSKNYHSTFMKAEFGYILYHGKTAYDLKNYLPSVYANIPGFTLPYNLTSGLFMRNGYIGIRWKSIYASIGKQQIGWGSGYAYNPTNIFQYKTLIDLNDEIDGVNSVKLKVNMPLNLSVETVILPKSVLDSTSFATEIKGYYPALDFSTGFAYYIYTDFDSLTLNLTDNRYKLILSDFSTNILNFNIYGEGFYNLDRKKIVTVLGGGYTTDDNSLSINFEYLYNGYGKTKNYNLADWLDFLSGYELSLGKHEIILNINKSYDNEYIKFNIATLFNPIDRTGLVLPEIDIIPNENSTIMLIPMIPFGKDNPSNGGSEYTNFPYGGQFRIKINF